MDWFLYDRDLRYERVKVSESGFDSTNKNHKFEQNMNMSSLFKVFTTNEIF